MKFNSLKTSCLTILAAALLAVPAPGRAQNAATNAHAATPPAPKARVARPLPMQGKVSAVDTNAMTFVIGQTTLEVTSATKITKNGKPAVLAELTVGETVTCSYKKDDSGKSSAISVRVVPLAKPAPAPADPASHP